MESQVVIGALLPHPPIVIPEVGGHALDQVKRTVAGIERAVHAVKGAAAESLVVISPHGVVSPRAITMLACDPLAGDLSPFGFPEVGVSFPVDHEFRETIMAEAAARGLPVHVQDGPCRLDHGAIVPLHFFRRAGVNLPLVVFTPPPDDPELAYSFGQSVQRAASLLGRRAAVIASGDLSHRLQPGSPGGYDPRGGDFDSLLTERLARGESDDLLDVPPDLVRAAGQDVLDSIAVLLGALHGLEARSELLAYEGPFGVGYAVAVWAVSGRRRESFPVRVARGALAALFTGRSLTGEELLAEILSPGEAPPAEMAACAGAFVSLKKFGALRGCVGTPEPESPNLVEEIILNAVSAATRDRRFPPVRAEELGDLEISVDVLGPLEPVAPAGEIDPARYGVLVLRGLRRGLLLPALPGIGDAREQLALACRKAGLSPDDPGLEIYRFTTTRYH